MGDYCQGRWHKLGLHFLKEACGPQSGVQENSVLLPPCCLLHPLSPRDKVHHPVHPLLLPCIKNTLVLLPMRSIRWEHSGKCIQNKHFTCCILNGKAWMAPFVLLNFNRWGSENMVRGANVAKGGFCYFQATLKLLYLAITY